ncbi:hypothetical protein MMC13_005815 [Lambiella insularis]|nr:hypothetical protein [Lambiella insularis]
MTEDKNNWKGWSEIESDPAFFNVMLKQLGVKGLRVREVVSLDDEIVAFLPRPIYGLIFLFNWREDDPVKQELICPPNVWFANQTVGNACATVALLNIVYNIPNIDLGLPLQSFRDFTAEFPPALRGDAIGKFEFVRNVHNSFVRKIDMLNIDLQMQYDYGAAKKPLKKKGGKAVNDATAFHFIAFIPVDGTLWKLDGLEKQPHSLGTVSSSDWLGQVKPDLEARMTEYNDEQIDFAILSVVQDPLVRLVRDLACNVKCIQILDSHLDDRRPDWRNNDAPANAEGAIVATHTLTGPNIHYELDELAVNHVLLRHDIQCRLATDNASELLDIRQSLASEQGLLRASILEEQESDRKDDDKAAACCQDHGPLIRKWLLFLARKGVLKMLLASEKVEGADELE